MADLGAGVLELCLCTQYSVRTYYEHESLNALRSHDSLFNDCGLHTSEICWYVPVNLIFVVDTSEICYELIATK